MSLLKKTIPQNLLEEKAKFLEDHSYNPQFTYEEPVEEESLLKYGVPQKKYLDLAREILEKAYFGRNEADLIMMEGPKLSQEEVTQRFYRFLEMHQIQDKYQIVWSSSFVSRASIDESTLKLRTNAEFREEGLIGLIYHEIGTHALRRENYEQQPWYKKKKKYGLTTDYLRTEEGLAALHGLIPHTYKLAYNTAIRYLAVDYAQSHSLTETWQFLSKYVSDIETRWMITFRQKRGVSDTSQPGGFTKDLVYFEGMIEVWKWLKQNDFNPQKLYYGKIASQDAEKAFAMDPNYQPLLPSFYILNKEKYGQELEEVGKINLLEQI